MNPSALLIEVGTEELPPKSLRKLAEAFHAGFLVKLDESLIAHGVSRWFATPRRLAVLVDGVAARQQDIVTEKLGPALSAAFATDGTPTPAASGFARGCGVAVQELGRTAGERGERLLFRKTSPGRPTVELVPAQVEAALRELPIAKRMRWGSHRAEFVRPLQWLVMLHGATLIPGAVLGIEAGRETRGHRIHGERRISLDEASHYEAALRQRGSVHADYEARKQLISAQVAEQSRLLQANALADDDLLEEVCSLVEWPHALTGHFESRFLAVPAEALVSSMKKHQKYFPVTDDRGTLLPHFITVANLDSRDPAQVIAGNERVIRPRLADAAFFFGQDKLVSLVQRRDKLRTVVFQTELGTLWDKTERVASLARLIGAELNLDVDLCERAALLSKSDLVCDMVQEFDELQGTMGYYYALHDGEDSELATALREQYLPRHAGDTLPGSALGATLAVADRLDTLVGIFGIGQIPSGSKDPFGLRRAALGVLRILIENKLDLDLRRLTEHARDSHRSLPHAETVVATVVDYILERLRAWFGDAGIGVESFLAVQARAITRPLDFEHRVRAVHAFAQLPEAVSLAAANKRVANILGKHSGNRIPDVIDPGLFQEQAERQLADLLAEKSALVRPLVAAANYAEALQELAGLRHSVDAFFDQILVMADDPRLRANRLALLNALRNAFLEVADISLLAVSA